MKNKNLTIVFYTANKISNYFAENIKKQLLKVVDSLPIISVSQKPIDFGKNICCGNIGQSTLNIYRQALIGVKSAKTKYVALVEDDVLYSKEHFDFFPLKDDIFYYDDNIWNIYTWTKPPVFSCKGRRNLNGLICKKDLFIEAIEERFAKYPDDKTAPTCWGEPGKYERQMKVKVNKSEFYHAKEPSIVFSHPTELSYLHLGKRKKLGRKICEELKPWGSAEKIIKMYIDK